MSWLELEKRLRNLEPQRKDGRIDYQWGAGGEHWRLQSFLSTSQRDQFIALARMAGNKLIDMDDNKNNIANITSAENLWFEALKERGKGYSFQHYLEQRDENGNSGGVIYIGRLTHATEESANFCLDLAANEKQQSGKETNVEEETSNSKELIDRLKEHPYIIGFLLLAALISAAEVYTHIFAMVFQLMFNT